MHFDAIPIPVKSCRKERTTLCRTAPLLVFYICFVLSAVSWASPGKPSWWSGDREFRIYLEAVAKIREYSIYPNDYIDEKTFFWDNVTRLRVRFGYEISQEELAQKTILLYLQRRGDLFSDYLIPSEYKGFIASQKFNYAGVGMDINKERSRVRCFPYPGSPAEEGGLSHGDIIMNVDGRSTAGQSVYLIGSWIRGKPGTEVILTVRSDSGPARRVTVIRSPIVHKSVANQESASLRLIKIWRFTKQTPAELKDALASFPPGQPVVLDLRGNTGGNLQASVDAAALFLAQGRKIVNLQKKSGKESFRSIQSHSIPILPSISGRTVIRPAPRKFLSPP